MERGVFYILASSPEGRDLAWSSIEGERATWARERETLKLANESLARSLERQDLALAHMREAWDRERELLIEREASAVADLQKQVDFSDGLISVRSVLESIVTTAFPNRSATDALRCYCDNPKFQEYLAIVGADKASPRRTLRRAPKRCTECCRRQSTAAALTPRTPLPCRSLSCATSALFSPWPQSSDSSGVTCASTLAAHPPCSSSRRRRARRRTRRQARPRAPLLRERMLLSLSLLAATMAKVTLPRPAPPALPPGAFSLAAPPSLPLPQRMSEVLDLALYGCA